VHVPFAAPCKGRFARLPIRPLASASTSETSKTETVLQEAQGIYVGKGRYLRSDPESKEVRAALATGRDSALTGGFAGGEVRQTEINSVFQGAKCKHARKIQKQSSHWLRLPQIVRHSLSQ
jgi:hypothetical protein